MMSSCTIGLSSSVKAQPTVQSCHQMTCACIDWRPGMVSQHSWPSCMRLIAAAENAEIDRSCTKVRKPRPPDARSWDGMDSRVRGPQRSSCAARSYPYREILA